MGSLIIYWTESISRTALASLEAIPRSWNSVQMPMDWASHEYEKRKTICQARFAMAV
jgi:hypothetical protein